MSSYGYVNRSAIDMVLFTIIVAIVWVSCNSAVNRCKADKEHAIQQLNVPKEQLNNPDVNAGTIRIDDHQFVYVRSGTDIIVEHSTMCRKCH